MTSRRILLGVLTTSALAGAHASRADEPPVPATGATTGTADAAPATTAAPPATTTTATMAAPGASPAAAPAAATTSAAPAAEVGADAVVKGPPTRPTDDDDDDDGGRAGGVDYRPGKGFFLRGRHAALRIRTIVEPVLRFSYLDCGPSLAACPEPQAAMTIRRGRAGFKATLPHHLGLDVEVQIKNLLFGITHFYGVWSPSKRLEVQVGFIKPPGNIERTVNTWQVPWIERGVVSAWVSIARVMGVMATGTSADGQLRWQAAASKPVARGLDGAESEDQPPPRKGAIDADDAIAGAGQWNVDGRLEWAPSKDFELGVAGGARFRGDGDPGDNAPEPYDSPVAIAHQYTGVMVHGTLDTVVRRPRFKLIAELGARRDGETAELNDDGSRPTGHQVGYVGEVTVGYAPRGAYASAQQLAHLKKGWELLARANAVRVDQPAGEQAGFGGVARFAGLEVGVAAQLHKQLRLQLDAAYQWFGSNAYGDNAGARRVWAQAWAVWRM